MQEQSLNRWRVITDPNSAKVLFDRSHRTRLAPFMADARTVGEVAELLGEDGRLTYHHVQRYVKLSLLECVRSEMRWGKPLKYYAATAQGFFVPYEHLLAHDREAALNEVDVPMQKTFNKCLTQEVKRYEPKEQKGRRFFLDGRGTLIPLYAPPPEFGEYDYHDAAEAADFAYWTYWQEAYLTPEEAKAVQRELIRLSRRLLGAKAGEGRRRYLIRTGMTPS